MFSNNPYLEPAAGTKDYERERFEPIVALHETTDSYRISMDVPGCTEEHLDVRVGAHAVVVRCSRAIDRCCDGEARIGSFLRSLHLAHAVDIAGVRTVVRGGMLDIAAPKIRT